MFCQNCGKEIPNDSVFCPECGMKQETHLAIQAPVQNRSMKFCSNCGTQMPADSRFCPECRTKQSDVAEISPIGLQTQGTTRPQSIPKASVSPEKQVKIKKRNKIIGISFVGVIVLCVIIGVLFALIKPSINLNKYLTVTFEGYDTMGKAVVTFDDEQFEEDYGKKLSAITGKKSFSLNEDMGEKTNLEPLFDFYGASSASGQFLSNCVNGFIDSTSRLSNGDVVKYTWECNDEYALEAYGFKLKHEDIEYTVEGLAEAKTFDPFEGIEVVFSGIAPNGSASIEGEPSVEAAKNLEFELDNYSGLSVGDTVTLTATMDYDDPVEYCIENYGMIPSTLTKEYKVEGLDSYIQAAADISEVSLREMQKQAEDVYDAYVAQNWGDDEILKNFSYMGNYLLVNKNQDDSWNSHNELYLVYKVQVKDKYADGGKKYNKTNDIYWYIGFYDLLVDSDGTMTVDVTDYTTPDDGFTIDSGISSGWWSTKSWYYYGYQTLDELYKTVVIENAESFKHEDNVKKSEPADKTNNTNENKEIGEEGIIFPNSSDEVIKRSDIKALSNEELRFAINELYARHGYKFRDKSLRNYYKKYDWYIPKVNPDDFSISMFNAIEKENIETMQKVRDNRN